MHGSLDLAAGLAHRACVMTQAQPRIIVFDSGLGGLTVLSHVRAARPDAAIRYIADDAGFPYGAWSADALSARIVALFERVLADEPADCVVIACNTASTLVLPALRARFDTPFVGTVPAIKPAAAQTRSGLISVLATPGTVARDYTHGLIRAFAQGCEVTLVGSSKLAAFAEAEMRGEPVSDEAVRAEIAPCFVEKDGRRTDVVTLSCTHYPLLAERLAALAPWPVSWIDPAPAIARRMLQLIGERPRGGALPGSLTGAFTGRAAPSGALASALAARGLTPISTGLFPL
jgi:glutamate racemase